VSEQHFSLPDGWRLECGNTRTVIHRLPIKPTPHFRAPTVSVRKRSVRSGFHGEALGEESLRRDASVRRATRGTDPFSLESRTPVVRSADLLGLRLDELVESQAKERPREGCALPSTRSAIHRTTRSGADRPARSSPLSGSLTSSGLNHRIDASRAATPPLGAFVDQPRSGPDAVSIRLGRVVEDVCPDHPQRPRSASAM